MSRPTLLFYISGHGYGHAVRESFLINLVPEKFDVIITTTIPEDLFYEELTRPFTYRRRQFDLGCIQKDAVTVDIDATIEEYAQIAEANQHSLESECAYFADKNPVALIADIVPFASQIAQVLQIPSFAISNFSWYETYTHYTESRSLLLAELRKLYQQFDYWIRLSPGETLPEDFSGKETLRSVALLRRGTSCKAAICDYYNIAPNKKLVLLYTGTYGLDRVAWEKLERFTEVEFVGYYPLTCKVDNFTLVQKERFTLQDFSASADCIISKLGYGIVTEALSSGTPFLFLPRENFIEYPALKSAMQSAGNCMEISEERFNQLDIALEMNVLFSQRISPMLEEGNVRILQWILERI